MKAMTTDEPFLCWFDRPMSEDDLAKCAESVPSCMTVPEWTFWCGANFNAGGNKAKSPCLDCTDEFKQSCLVDGTCVLVTTAEQAKTEQGECHE